MPLAQIKLYTVEEAEKTLPFVQRIIRDIQFNFAEHETRLLERKKLPLSPSPGSAAEESAHKLENEMEHFEHEVVRFQRELEGMGIELKDYKLGLLDFYTRYDGKIVYLCWKADEGGALHYWHGLHEGARGRQSITPANRGKFKGLEPGQKFVEVDLKK